MRANAGLSITARLRGWCRAIIAALVPRDEPVLEHVELAQRGLFVGPKIAQLENLLADVPLGGTQRSRGTALADPREGSLSWVLTN